MKINKVLLLFILSVVFIIVSTWKILNSEYLADKVSVVIGNLLETKLGSSFVFKRSSLLLFPPGVELHNASYEQKFDEKTSFATEVGRIRITFNVFDILANKLSIKQVKFFDGYISFDIDTVEKDDSKITEDKMFLRNLEERFVDRWTHYNEIYKLFVKNTPVAIKKLSLQRIEFFLNKRKILSANIDSDLGRKVIDIETEFTFFKKEILGTKTPDILNFDLQWGSNEILLKKILIRKEDSFLTVQGQIKKEQVLHLVDIEVESSISSHFLCEETNLIPNCAEHLQNFYHISSASINGPIRDSKAELRGSFQEINTPYFDGERIDYQFDINKEIVILKSFSFQKNSERVNLKAGSYEVAKSWKLIPVVLPIEVKSMRTNTVLKALGPELDPMKLIISGEIDVDFNFERIVFDLKDLSQLEQVLVRFEDSKSPLLNTKPLISKGVLINLSLKDYSLSMKGELAGKNSLFKFTGAMNDKGLEFTVPDTRIDLEELGPIGGVPFIGKAKGDIAINGAWEDIKFNFNLKAKEFRFLDIDFQDIEMIKVLSLKDGILRFRSISGKSRDVFYQGRGFLDLEKSYINLDGKFKESSFHDLVLMFESYLKDIKPNLDPVVGRLNSHYTLKGPLDIKLIKVDGSLTSENFRHSLDNFSNLSINYSYENSNLKFSNIKFNKFSGRVIGFLNHDFILGDTGVQLNLNRIPLDSFSFYQGLNFGLNAFVEGGVNANFTKKSFEVTSDLKFVDSQIAFQRVPNSSMTIFFDDNVFKSNFAFIGDDISGDTEIFWKDDRLSKINIRNKVSDIKILMSALGSHNIKDSSLKGSIQGDLFLEFLYRDWKSLTAVANFKKVQIQRRNFNLENENEISIKIKKGLVEEWKSDFRGKNGNLSLVGSGHLEKGFSLSSNYQFPIHILDVLSPSLLGRYGTIKGDFDLFYNSSIFNFGGTLSSNNLGFRIRGLNEDFENIQLISSFDDSQFSFEKFEGRFAGGVFKLDGRVGFTSIIPNFDLRMILLGANYPLFKSSQIVLSGNAFLKGEKPPYTLNANLVIDDGVIRDEINDLNIQADEERSFTRFIPDLDKSQKISDFLRTNINVRTALPLKVKNSLAELYFNGGINLSGTFSNYLIKGRLEADSQKSKFFFKSNDFNITRGNLDFRGDNLRNMPYLDFLGKSQINQYLVSIGISGRADKREIMLSSDPGLSQQDLLSLLALGYTAGDSPQDQSISSSATGLGLGSLLFDQFGINRGLNSNLGLKLNLSSEVRENEDSLLQGRTAGYDSATRTRTSTKVKVQKQLSSAIDLSVSSTVGNDSEARQEMNLDFKLDNNFIIQGVYEREDKNEGDQQANPDSIGADFKFRYPF